MRKYKTDMRARFIASSFLIVIIAGMVYVNWKFADFNNWAIYVTAIGAAIGLLYFATLSLEIGNGKIVYRFFFFKQIVLSRDIDKIVESLDIMQRKGTKKYNLFVYKKDGKRVKISNSHGFQDYKKMYRDIETFLGHQIRTEKMTFKEYKNL